MSAPKIVCVPMKLDAFRLNQDACDYPSRLAPLSQPDYTNFRLGGDHQTKHDVLQDVDLHNTGPNFDYRYNDRVTDLASGDVMRNRLGNYIHWILPRFYRTGLTIPQSTKKREDLINKLGYQVPHAEDPNSLDPLYRPIPTRWVVVRHIINQPSNVTLPEFEAFVVESDRLQKLADLDSDVDIQVDVSPFIHLENHPRLQVGDGGGSVKGEIDYQGENFIGFKQPLKNWRKENVPRVKLSTANTFNPLFTDYQPHNSNVFSILDNFSYTDHDGEVNYADDAEANYYVIGWHEDQNEDPFHNSDAERLKAYSMQLANGASPASISGTVLHGAIYNVSWDVNAAPQHDRNEDVAELYENHIGHIDRPNYSPVAVGGSPLDALIAVMETHQYQDGGVRVPVAQDLLALQTLVHKVEEDPDSQLQAADALHTSCFIPSDGGLFWQVSGTNDAKQPVVPSKELKAVNEHQMFVDLCVREMKSLQWLIWAEWWKWVNRDPERGDDSKAAVQAHVNKLVTSYNALKTQMRVTNAMISVITKRHKDWKSAPKPRYYIPKDPTILLCGMKNPWPIDWNDPLAVRLNSQLIDDTPIPPSKFTSFRHEFIPKLPSQIRVTVDRLLAEFYNLGDPESEKKLKNPLPLYHDTLGSTEDTKRDDWAETQPWYPLFVEWEIEYLHINKDFWELEERKAYGPPMLRNKIVDKGNGGQIDFKNIRILSGREFIVPQVTKVLQNAVVQLLKIKKPQDEQLLKEIRDLFHKIPFLNITLSGIRDQLATRHRGTHVSPTIYDPGNPDGGRPLKEAILASEGVISEEALRLISDTIEVPFGDFPDHGSATSPFKPVTHGQLRFTKLNVIDKFGRALCAINPERGAADRLYPYISEMYSSSDVPATLRTGNHIWEKGEIIQIEPSINQDSRINAHYISWDDHAKAWVPATEYDEPIWGWLVVNYADRGLQMFLPDGTFYREIRLGEGVSTSVKWLPFEAPTDPKVEAPSRQLMEFIGALAKDNGKMLQEIFSAITEALESDAVPYADGLYAGYLPSITGRPLALVNTGWSLELSHPFYVNQSTISRDSREPNLKEYKFPIKLGDRERTFDGFVGYFCQERQDVESPYSFKTFYTYFAKEDSDTTKLIKPANYPRLTPYYNSPFDISTDRAKEPAKIVAEYNKELNVFAMLVDPFSTIHGYTTCQPIKELRLPHWGLERSLQRITAFFRLGPIVMPTDAPSYDESRTFTSGLDLKDIDKLLKSVPPFPVPSVTIADWAWLQPYHNDAVEEEKQISYNPFPVTAMKRPPEFNEAPYTAVEGYLYLKKPIAERDPEDT